MLMEKCNIITSLLKEKLAEKLSLLEKRNESECTDLNVLNSSVVVMKSIYNFIRKFTFMWNPTWGIFKESRRKDD